MPSHNLNTAMQAQHTWIVNFVRTKDQKFNADVSDVHVCGIPGFKGGGGGLYCKRDENEKTFTTMKGAAVAQARAPEGEIEKGKFLLVRSDPTKPGEKAVVCFIMWHEFGHALADRGYGSNAGEQSAWEFEVKAITHAVKNNSLPQGITSDMVWGYLDMRRKNFTAKELPNKVLKLEGYLGARPTEITEGYVWAAKTTCINHLGQLDADRFKKVILEKFPSLTPGNKELIKKVTENAVKIT